MANINTYIYNTNTNTCIYNASGCYCTNETELDDLLNSNTCAVVTKSSTILPRLGNQKPRIFLTNLGSINSMGIPNHGIEYYVNYYNNKKKYCLEKNKPYIQSIYPFSKDEMIHMINYITTSNTNIEINLSCPNVNKVIVPYDYQNFELYLDAINNIKSYNNFCVGLKLPPYYHNYEFDTVANLLLKYDCIDHVITINSVCNGLLVDTETEKTLILPNSGYGGIGGDYILPTTLANINSFYKRLNDKTTVIGCGGIKTGEDVFKHILCGAKAVQVGTTLWKEGIYCFERINSELKNIMIKKNYSCIEDFRGNLNNYKKSDSLNSDI